MNEELENEILLASLVDGSMSKEDAKKARELLLSSPKWRKIYLKHARLNHLLSEKYEGSHPVRVTQPRPHWWRRSEAYTLAAILTLLAIAGFLMLVGKEPESTLVQYGPESYGRIVHPDGLSGKDVLFPGSKLELLRGAVSLEFPTGVTALIEGPAEMAMSDRNAMHLTEGRGFFHVPDGAEGFVCTTSSFFVEDLGTEFGVVAGDVEEIHVIEGQVRLKPRMEDGELRTLGAGERIGWSDSALTLSIPKRDFASKFAGRLTVLADDFDEPDGTRLHGKTLDLGKGVWEVTKGNPVIEGNMLRTSGAYRKAAFVALDSGLNEMNHVLLLTVEAETSENTLYAPGWAGVSLYTGDEERIFIGDPTGPGVSWGLHPAGWQVQNAIPKANGKTIVTLRYDFRTGLTELFEGETTAGAPLASEWIAPGLVFDRLRVANGSHFEGAIDAGADVYKLEEIENMNVRSDISIRSLKVDLLKSESSSKSEDQSTAKK